MTIAPSVAQLIDNVRQPFEHAHAMPPGVYTSPDFLEQEIKHVFAREWVTVGRASALPNAGDYLTYELAGQPIFVIRDIDGRLRAMSNVCLHRMSTLLEGSGNKRAIVCPYHAWTYNLDGTLRAAPAMTLNTAFCKESYRLPQVRCEEWLGWIMVTLNADAPSVSEQFADVQALIDDYGMESYIETFRETHIWNTNWKILAEISWRATICPSATRRRSAACRSSRRWCARRGSQPSTITPSSKTAL